MQYLGYLWQSFIWLQIFKILRVSSHSVFIDFKPILNFLCCVGAVTLMHPYRNVEDPDPPLDWSGEELRGGIILT